MHLGLRELATFFAGHRDAQSLVLATVTATEGSTYRKPGAMMLIEPGGAFAGLISGGCLEADLVQQAKPVFEDGRPRRISYDLYDGEDRVFSLGLGCGGNIHLLLQRLDREDGFGFLAGIFEALGTRRTCWLALVLDEPHLGAACLRGASGETAGAPGLQTVLERVAQGETSDSRVTETEAEIEGRSVRAVVVRIDPPPRVLICGGGPDAVPMAQQVAALGWEGTVTDHRPAFVDSGRYAAGIEVCLSRPGKISQALELGAFDAAVVMSHHLEHDVSYLRQLRPAKGIRYVGLLGPARRREQLERELDLPAGWIHGPAGFDIGAELPAAIALSVMSEIHAVLNGRSGRPLAADGSL